MKKTLLKYIAVFVFVVGTAMFFANKIEAAVTASISASSTSVNVGSPSVGISFVSSGADSCTVKLNGSTVSTSFSGSLTLGTSTAGTFTYTISCTKTYPTTTSCIDGFYVEGDTLHPDGGTVTYTAPNGTPAQEGPGLWMGHPIWVEYRTGTIRTFGAGINAGNCP